VPLTLTDYMLRWCLNQHVALLCKDLFPDRMHIVHTDNVMAGPRAALSPLCGALGIEPGPSLDVPSWNGERLDDISPWGTIRRASTEANRATAAELSAEEQAAVLRHAGLFLERFGYSDFLQT
jgi:hypothetical protein